MFHFLIFVGVLSYKISTSYSIFSHLINGNQTIKLTFVGENLDKSGANPPVLSENMIPVYYDESCNDTGCWRKADKNNSNTKYKWYDYENKMWANSVTVSTNSEGIRTDLTESKPGTEIPISRINTMLVWIPRYKYTIWNYNSDGTVTSQPQEILIEFEKETENTSEIKCTDNIKGTSDGTANGTETTISEICKLKLTGAECTDAICNDMTYTHPAFTFGDKELTGFWIDKFEASSDIDCTAEIGSPIEQGCNLTNIKSLVKANLKSWHSAMTGTFYNNIKKMNDTENIYGFALTDDTHMIKNMEWGATVYFSHSKYGINGSVALNSYSNFMTGCGPQEEGSVTSGTTCNSYNTVLGQSASTTGNIYGVYDMNGGATEYVMATMISPAGTNIMSGGNYTDYKYSGFSGILYDSGNYKYYEGVYGSPDNKYLDQYSFGKSVTAKTKSKLGDAIKEVSTSSNSAWYGTDSVVGHQTGSWLDRGSRSITGDKSGIFYSYYNVARSYDGNGTRVVVSQ